MYQTIHFFSSKKIAISIFLILTLFVIFLISNFYTFCWSDESFYISSVHRLINGDNLFTDEWHPTLFYNPLLLPFYHLYVFFAGGVDGIYLAARITQLILRLVTSLFIFFTLRKQSDDFSALFSALLFMTFMRGNILGLSYYALSLDFFVLGILCLYNYYLENKKNIIVFISGIFFVFSILCNPFIVFIYIGYSIWILIKTKLKLETIKPVLFVWAGTIITGIFYILYLSTTTTLAGFFYSFHNIFETPHYQTTSLYDTILSPLFNYLEDILLPYKYSFLFYFSVIFTLLVLKIKRKQMSNKVKNYLNILNILFFIYNLKVRSNIPGSIFLAPVFFIFTQIFLYSGNFFDKNKYISFFIIPGLLLSVAWEYCSDTRFKVLPIGFVAAMPGYICLIYETTKVSFAKTKGQHLFLAFLYCIMLSLAIFQRFHYIYRDGESSAPIYKIERGPAKGLFTSNERKQKYDDVYETVSKILTEYPDKTIYITPMIPWAYLLFNTRYAGPSTWRGYLDDYQVYNYFEKDKHPYPDLILITNKEYTIDSPYKIPKSEYANILLQKYEKKQLSIGVLFVRK